MSVVIQELEQSFDQLPSTKSLADFMLEDYAKEALNIQRLAKTFKDEGITAALSYYSMAARVVHRDYAVTDMQRLFKEPDQAIKALDARYWQKLLGNLQVMRFLPKKLRDEWTDACQELKTPPFDKEHISATLETLLSKQGEYFAMMVDGIFTGLSKEHLTNRPEGFTKRIIIAGVKGDGIFTQYPKVGFIHDLRFVIAKFMGFEVPNYENDTEKLLDSIYKTTGVWHDVDGGAFRIRVYLNGNAHMEIHPQIAYRLNQILAMLHPMAIPEPHRRKPNPNTYKNVMLVNNLIPLGIVETLQKLQVKGQEVNISWQLDKHTKKKVGNILLAIGGQHVASDKYVFDYHVSPIIDKIIISRIYPDYQSYQYYPTPKHIALAAINMADLSPQDTILEPSAGQGGIATHIKTGHLTCVEIAPLHCAILEAKHINHVHCMDFMRFKGKKFSKIIMNPPYSHQRLRQHIEHAFSMLEYGGALIVIIPASYRGKTIIKDAKHIYDPTVYADFENTNIQTVIVRIEHG